MKRLTIVVAALAAALIAGCGGSGSGNATEDALSFMPKDAPVVISIDTDPNGEQWQQVNKLIGKFPFAGQIKAQAKQGFNTSSKLDFDKDVKPILGNDFVFAIPDTAALKQSNSPAIGAMKVKDEGKAEDFLKKDAQKTTTVDGTDVYKESSDTYLALKDGTLVIADNTQLLGAALKRHDGSDHMSQDDFDNLMGGVSGDGLLKAGVNVQQVIGAQPKAAAARKVKWVDGLRDSGAVLSAQSDGLELNFKTTTEGVSAADLPLAAGAQSAPVVRRASDVGFGMRNIAQTVRFAEMASQLTNPRGYTRFLAQKKKLNKTLGIDLDKDVVDQFQGDASLSVGIDGGFALRTSLRDPKAFQATLRKAAPKLTKAAKGKHVGVAVPKRPNGFYALATAKGKKYVFAVIGGKFVLATDPGRAAQFAGQSATPVPGAKGSLVTAMDTRSIVNQVAKRQGQGQAAIVTGALGDFIGSVESETSGLAGRFKLTIK
jgi:uncharacterized protein DUF3352